jgi:hypothetical protein
MSWIRSIRSEDAKFRSPALAEGLLLLAVLCLAIVTAVRVLTIEAHSTPADRALSPLSSAGSLTP